MRAYQLSSYEGPQALKLVDASVPQAATGAVLIDVRAIGINFPDLLTTSGQLPDLPDPPFIPGREISGVVRQAD